MFSLEALHVRIFSVNESIMNVNLCVYTQRANPHSNYICSLNPMLPRGRTVKVQAKYYATWKDQLIRFQFSFKICSLLHVLAVVIATYVRQNRKMASEPEKVYVHMTVHRNKFIYNKTK